MVELRDHRYPCEHGNNLSHSTSGSNVHSVKWCPGGGLVEATRMDWCKTHGMHWMHWPEDAPYCIAHHIDPDEAERIGKCVRTSVLIVEEQQCPT